MDKDGAALEGLQRTLSEWTHVWYWRKVMPERKGKLCRVVATGTLNSALVEFEDGHKCVTSRYAVRKLR